MQYKVHGPIERVSQVLGGGWIRYNVRKADDIKMCWHGDWGEIIHDVSEEFKKLEIYLSPFADGTTRVILIVSKGDFFREGAQILLKDLRELGYNPLPWHSPAINPSPE